MLDLSTVIKEEKQHDIMSTLTEVSSWASLVGTMFIVISYLAFKEIRHFHLRLVFILAITDLFVSITFILNLHMDIATDHIRCQVLAAFLQFFELASALWALCIAFVLDRVIRLNDYHVEQYEKYFYVFCWGVPSITVIASYFQGLYVNTGLWCWISDDIRGLYRWLYFYGPLVLILFYVSAIYVIISKKIRAQLALTSNFYQINNEATIQQTFRWYIIGWVICWVPAITDRVQDVINPGHPIFILAAAHSFFAPLAGFANSIAIGFNDEIQTQYRQLAAKLGLRKRTKLGHKPKNIQDKDTKLMQERLQEYDVSTD